MEDEMSTGKAGKLPLRTKVLMAVVAIITLIAVWLVPGDRQPVPPPLPDLPAAPQAGADLPPLVEDSDADSRPGDRARTFVADLRSGDTEPDPDTVFVEAERLQGEGHSVDAYLLYRFAARHGHGQAALVLGTQSDTAFHAADNPGSLNDEPEQAYKWYSIAAAEGIEEATVRLQALRKRVEQSAATGDERAQRLILQWQ
jgi:TPR repeat protein